MKATKQLTLTQGQLDHKTMDGLTWEILEEVNTFNGIVYTVFNKATSHIFNVVIK